MVAGILILVVWSMLWKGYALWTAAKSSQKGWFVAILIINSAGILEIIYIFAVAKKKLADVQRDFSRVLRSPK
jgi:pilus assembly protein TadC